MPGPGNPFLKPNYGNLAEINSSFGEILLHNKAKGEVIKAWGSVPIPPVWAQKFDALFQQPRDEWKQELKSGGDQKKVRSVSSIVKQHALFKEKKHQELDQKLGELFKDPSVPNDVKAQLDDVKEVILRQKEYLDKEKQKAFEKEEREIKEANHLNWAAVEQGRDPTELMLGKKGFQEGQTQIAENGQYDLKFRMKNSGDDLTLNRLKQALDSRGVVGSLLFEWWAPGTTQVRVNGPDIDFNPRHPEAQAFVVNHIRFSKEFPANADGTKSATIEIELEEAKTNRDGYKRLWDKLYDPELQRFKAQAIKTLTNTDNRDPKSLSAEQNLAIARKMEEMGIARKMWIEGQCGDPVVDLSFTTKGKDMGFKPDADDHKAVAERRAKEFEKAFKMKDEKDQKVEPTLDSIETQLDEQEEKEPAAAAANAASSSAPRPGGR